MWAQVRRRGSAKVSTKPASAKPADSSPAKVDPNAKSKEEAMAQYKRILECYKSGTLDEVKNEIKKITRMKYLLPRSAQSDLAYIPRTLAAYRPKWWKNMRSSSNVSFKATLWGRRLTANYVPSEMFGGQMPVGIKNGKLVTIVSWRPSMIDNPKPAKGYLARRHKLTKAAIGEAIGWHELGHTYIENFLPLKHVMELYENHERLYFHLQEFYADMTSLYHSSPGGRLALMFTRLDGLARYDESEEHDRAGHAIGALILASVMASPDRWPSFHFPPNVPGKDIELNTVFYLYETIDPNWTIKEDKALRAIIKKFIAAHGAKVLRMKGMVTLPGRIPFMLMVSDDRSHQKKRDAWVKKKLQSIIKDGRADKTDQVKKKSYEYRIEPY
jgi:hypothetical protein